MSSKRSNESVKTMGPNSLERVEVGKSYLYVGKLQATHRCVIKEVNGTSVIYNTNLGQSLSTHIALFKLTYKEDKSAGNW